MEDIFFDDDERMPTPERSFRYPLYERFLWLVAVLAGVAALVGYTQVRDFIEDAPRRGLAVICVVGVFLFAILWISLRAWMSKIIVSHTSLKMKAVGQGYQRISWSHVQRVVYKWRPLGHKLIFIGSDGAKVAFRSAISDYDLLMEFIRNNVPEAVNDQLEELFGEEAEDYDEDNGQAPETPDTEPSVQDDQGDDEPDTDDNDDIAEDQEEEDNERPA